MLVLQLMMLTLSIICLMESPNEAAVPNLMMEVNPEKMTMKKNTPSDKVDRDMERKKKPKPKPKCKKYNKKKCLKKCKLCSNHKDCKKCCQKWCKVTTTVPTTTSTTTTTTTTTTTATTTKTPTTATTTKSTTTDTTTKTPTTANTTKSTTKATTTKSTTTATTTKSTTKATTTKSTTTATTTKITTDTTTKTKTTASTIATTTAIATSGTSDTCYDARDKGTSSYRGTQSTTKSGRTCQKWTEQKPHSHDKTPENFPDGGLGDHNYCRRPAENGIASSPWCYTTDSKKRWEHCGIPFCQTCVANGKPCLFPFKDTDGTEYNTCANFQDKYYWCATSLKSNGVYSGWEKCPEDGLCELPVSSTTVTSTVMPTTTVATVMPTTTVATAIPTTTVSLEETASTTVVLKDGENYFSCQIDFIFESTAGFKMNSNFSSSCSPASSADKHYKNLDEYSFYITTSSGAKIDCNINIIIQDEKTGINMAAKPMEKSLECSVDESECVTTSGQHYPTACIVPFIHEGRKYQACTDKGGKEEGKTWCATAVDENQEMTKWGYCSAACGYCGGKDVSGGDTRTLGDCGYDCFINPYKQMEPETIGMDPKLLLGPQVYVETTMPTWNKKANGQYQFLKGDPGLFLDCTNGFDRFPCYKTIYINCTGNYRFNVYSAEIKDDDQTATIGHIVKTDVKNVHIGCGPCPLGFDYKVGDEEPTSDNNRGKFTVEDIGACGELCHKLNCSTFVFSSNEKYCELNSKRVETPSNPKQYRDYRLCTKETDNMCPPAQTDCGYNSKVDPDRLVAEQNSVYLMSTMDNNKYTDVFEVLNWSQGFGSPKINVDLLDGMEKKKSSGFYMLLLVPASMSCDRTLFDENQERQFAIHMNIFSNIKTVEDELKKLTNNLDNKIPYWMSSVFMEANPHICMVMQSTHFFVARNRVQTYTSLFNFAIESGRKFDKFYPFKKCSTKSLTISAIENIAKESYEDVSFDESENSMREWDGIIPIRINKKSGSSTKTVIFVETETGTAKEDDFIMFKGPIIFPKGATTAVLLIHINIDQEDEDEEYFYLITKPFGSSGLQNNKIKISLSDFSGSVIEMKDNNLRDFNELQQRMKGSIVISGTEAFDGRTVQYIKNDDGGDTVKNGDINNVAVQYIQIKAPAKHNIVMFKKQPSNSMEFFDDTATYGQTIITMPGQIPANVLVSTSHVKTIKPNVQYLPWIKDTIAFRELTTKDEAFTAQISGCGIRLFKMMDNKNQWHTYLSHDNAYNLGGGCPKDADFTSALRAFFSKTLFSFTNIIYIAKIYPVELQWPGTVRTDYSIYDEVIGSTTVRTEYIGRAAASAVWVKAGKWVTYDQWCLALQRSIIVYDILELDYVGLLYHVYSSLETSITHYTEEDDPQILVLKPVKDRFGFELLCEEKYVRLSYHQNSIAPIQKAYWNMEARIVEVHDGYGGMEMKIYVFDDHTINLYGWDLNPSYGRKLYELFPYGNNIPY